VKVKKLLMLSCGIDSTYLAWKMVMDKTPDLHFHHVSLRTREPLWKKQDERVEPILSYLREIHDFEYTESMFEYSYPHMGFDSDLLLLVAQKVCQMFSHFKWIEVYMGWNPTDMTRRLVADRAKRNVTPNIWSALVESARNRQYIDHKLHFPLIEQNIVKIDMMKEIPKKLLDLTWSCRNANNCGICQTCKDIEQAKKIIGS